jgi:hypothetical protein
VQNVQTFWERFTIGPSCVGNVRVADPYEVDVPIALRLDFAAGPVWMVAGIPQWPEMQEVFVPGDELIAASEPDRHALDPVDEIGPEPGDLAVEFDTGHPLSDSLQQHPQLKRG